MEDSPLSQLVAQCPIVQAKLNDFLGVIRSMMKYITNQVQPSCERPSLQPPIKRIIATVPLLFVIRPQNCVGHWLRYSIPSVPLFCVFLQTRLLTVEHLDSIFFNSLNKHPLNYRLLIFAIHTYTVLWSNLALCSSHRTSS
jgi:hypothetical protein